MRLRLVLVAAAAAVALPAGGAAAAADDLRVAPVARIPFPERGLALSAPSGRELGDADVEVFENGRRVARVRVEPLAQSGLRYGVILALDASESMAGAPARAAVASARAFVAHRSPSEHVGLLAFNSSISLLQSPTADAAALRSSLRHRPPLDYGTRIYDALMRSLELLRAARLSSGSVVLLSDGADIGSTRGLEEVVAAARRQQVRIFTVGLRSGAFDSEPLRAIADRTGGSYAEAGSTAELEEIYEALGAQLAGEYLVRYRSAARPMSQVDVRLRVTGGGRARTTYVAPTPSNLPPYHRSLLSRFLLSEGSPLVISLFFATLVIVLLLLVLRRPTTSLVDRVRPFTADDRPATPEERSASPGPVGRPRQAPGWWAGLERDLEIARMTVTPAQVATRTLLGTLCFVVLALTTSSPVLALPGLVTPFVARGVIRMRLKKVRDEFADQFPASLQVLASALRAGYSFNGALGVVVDHAHEPAKSELRRVLRDDQLGVVLEDALRRLAARMANRDIEQVALLAELQRTSGGNSAEVLDTVVGTIRERADIRRLVRTLTAQGRMARWILTALPVFLTAFLWLVHPEVMKPFFTSGGGQAALVVAAVMVAAGSAFIQRIVDIEV